jgi:hypothetical protein
VIKWIFHTYTHGKTMVTITTLFLKVLIVERDKHLMSHESPQTSDANSMLVEWLDDAHTIIRSTGQGNWTWDDFYRGLNQILDMAQSVPHRVDLIYTSQAGSQPPKGSAMSHYQRAMRMMPENVGLQVFITSSMFARAIISMMTKLIPSMRASNFLLVGSLDEALSTIAQDRARTQV